MDLSDLKLRLEQLDRGPADAPARVEVLAQLAWASRFHGWVDVVELADQAHRLAVATDQLAPRALSGRALMLYRRWAHDLASALEIGQDALDAYRALGDRAGCAAVLDGLATVLEELGDYPTAFEYAREAYDIGVELSDRARQGWAMSSLGGLHAATGDRREAIRVLEQALQLFTAEDDAIGAGKISFRLGKVKLEAGDIAGARAAYETIAGSASVKYDGFRIGYGGLGDVARVEGDCAEARRLYELALREASKAGHAILVEVERSLAQLCIDEGELDEAQRRLDAMLAKAERSGAKPMLAQVHEMLCEVCERRGEMGAALEHYKRFSALRQQIIGDDTRAVIQHQRTRREVESARKDAEIHRLRYVELASMQAKLVQSEKLAVLGQLAAGIAHELNTPLGVLQSNLGVFRGVFERIAKLLGEAPNPRVIKLLDVAGSASATSEQAIERVTRFVDSVTSYSGVDQATAQHTDLRECVEAALSMAAPSLPPGIDVARRLEAVPSVWAHPAAVIQAIVAVVMSAAKAMPDGGELAVALSAEADHVVARVRDSGPGMSSEAVAQLFEVGFESTGRRVQVSLGLPTVAATMDALGGRAEATSEPGVGTTITLTFPVTSAAATRPAAC